MVIRDRNLDPNSLSLRGENIDEIAIVVQNWKNDAHKGYLVHLPASILVVIIGNITFST